MALDPKTFEELKSKNARAVALTAGAKTLVVGDDALTADGDTVVVAPPTRAQWRKFKTAMADERKRIDAYEIVLRDCLLYPAPAELEAMFDRRAALVEVFGDQVLELAGAGLEVEKNA